MGMGFAPTWLRQASPPPASQNHFNHCFLSFWLWNKPITPVEHKFQTVVTCAYRSYLLWLLYDRFQLEDGISSGRRCSCRSLDPSVVVARRASSPPAWVVAVCRSPADDQVFPSVARDLQAAPAVRRLHLLSRRRLVALLPPPLIHAPAWRHRCVINIINHTCVTQRQLQDIFWLRTDYDIFLRCINCYVMSATSNSNKYTSFQDCTQTSYVDNVVCSGITDR